MYVLRKKLVLVLVTSIALVATLHCWRSEGFRGTVTDANGNSIADAVVVCAWIFNGWHSTYYLAIHESKTDVQGVFAVDPWVKFLPLVGGHLSRIDYFIVHEEYVPKYYSAPQFAIGGSIGASPKKLPIFVLARKASVSDEILFRELNDFEDKICFLAAKPEISNFVRDDNLFAGQLRKIEKNHPDSGFNARDCGY